MENNDRAVGPPGDEHHDPPDTPPDGRPAGAETPDAVTADPLSSSGEHLADEGAPLGGALTNPTATVDSVDPEFEPQVEPAGGVRHEPEPEIGEPKSDSDNEAAPEFDPESRPQPESDSSTEPEPEPDEESEREPQAEPTVYARLADTCTALVDAVAQVEKLEARQAAWKAEFIDHARTLALAAEEGVLVTARSQTVEQRQDLALRSFIAELACTLRVAERTATALVEESEALLHRLPVTLGALREGEISYRHAQVLVDQVSTLSHDAAAELEERAVPFARTMTVSRFRQKTRMLRERLCPESAVARCRKSVTDRRVELIPAPDGMAWLNLFTTAPAAETIFDTIRAQSMRLQSPVETRTLSQLDADVVFAAMMEAFTGEYTLPDPTGTRVFGTGLGVRNPYTDPYPAPTAGTATERAPAPVPSASASGSAGVGAAGTGTGTGTGASEWGSTPSDTGRVAIDDSDRGRGSGGGTRNGSGNGGGDDNNSGSGGDHGRLTVVTAGPGHDPEGAFRRIVPTVMVTVPVLTLLGRSTEPGNLDGYGPIDPDTARDLASQAPEFSRILTHPETGVALSLGHTKYTPSKAMRRFLRYRDGYCRFPGCTRKAVSSDIDHTVPYETGGNTDFDNLASLCPKHHKLKHETEWEVEQLGDGVLKWTSPQGREYTTHPEYPVRNPVENSSPPAKAAPSKDPTTSDPGSSDSGNTCPDASEDEATDEGGYDPNPPPF